MNTNCYIYHLKKHMNIIYILLNLYTDNFTTLIYTNKILIYYIYIRIPCRWVEFLYKSI